MLAPMEANFEAAEITQRPKDFVADAGYYSDDNTQAVRSHNMTPYIAETSRRTAARPVWSHPAIAHSEAAYGPNAADEDRE